MEHAKLFILSAAVAHEPQKDGMFGVPSQHPGFHWLPHRAKQQTDRQQLDLQSLYILNAGPN